MEELISIIVPIYKVEEYIPECIDSIVNQTYRNLEIILVDDGSPDNCPKICEEYAKRDARIKVIHQKNQGLSAARNSGVATAKGEYIAFVDSDDTIHKDMYRYLYDNLKEYKADLSICDFRRVSMHNSVEKKEIYEMADSISIFSGQEALENLYNDRAVATIIACNKLYKKELWKNLQYKVGKIHEDEFIIHHILNRAEKVVYSNLPLYFYLSRDTSITGEKFNIKKLDYIEALENRLQFFEKHGYMHLYKKEYKRFLMLLVSNYYMVKKFCPKERQTLIDIRTKFFQAYKKSDKKDFSGYSRLKYNLFSFSPFIYKNAMELWNVGKIFK